MIGRVFKQCVHILAKNPLLLWATHFARSRGINDFLRPRSPIRVVFKIAIQECLVAVGVVLNVIQWCLSAKWALNKLKCSCSWARVQVHRFGGTLVGDKKIRLLPAKLIGEVQFSGPPLIHVLESQLRLQHKKSTSKSVWVLDMSTQTWNLRRGERIPIPK